MSLVTVLVNRSCGHCLRAIDEVADLAGRCGAHVAAVDITAHPGVAERLQLRTSPAVMFASGPVCPGVPSADIFSALVAASKAPSPRSPTSPSVLERAT